MLCYIFSKTPLSLMIVLVALHLLISVGGPTIAAGERSWVRMDEYRFYSRPAIKLVLLRY